MLKPGGQWLYITYQLPDFMKLLLERKDLYDHKIKLLGDSQRTGEYDYLGFVMKRPEATHNS